MDLPEIEVEPGASILQVSRHLEEACEERGINLSSYEALNTSLPISGTTNFYQAADGDGVQTIIVIVTEEWSDESLARIVNILLEIRADPDPPGTTLRFRFYSAHPVPRLLETLFGDFRISPLECRAALAASFGINLRPESCTRLASVGLQLLSSIGIRTAFTDPDGIRAISDFVLREVRSLGLPRDGAPLNTLVCVGCLYGEVLRTLLSCRTEWASVKEYQPWPCLVVRPRNPEIVAKGSSRTLGFNPIAMVILLSQDGSEDLLQKGAGSLIERTRRDFGESHES
jgi:hypothetical protein